MRNSQRSLRRRLWDILNAIEIARLSVGDLALHELQVDPVRRFAAERSIEVISEATRHIPEHLKQRAVDLPWSQIAGIGNVLRHGYDTIDLGIIVTIIRDDLTPLEQFVRVLAEELDQG